MTRQEVEVAMAWEDLIKNNPTSVLHPKAIVVESETLKVAVHIYFDSHEVLPLGHCSLTLSKSVLSQKQLTCW